MLIDVCVLGSVRVHVHDRDLRLGGDRQRALLARLVVGRGRVLSAERLIDELWDGFPPDDPVHALQARISRLRSVFPAKIEFVNGGYRVDPAQLQTDAGRFEQLYAEGGAALADGDHAAAAEHLHSALSLWRGHAFDGIPEIPALRAEAARLERLWSAALADRIDVDLTLGRAAAVIPELHGIVAERPLAEQHWGQLMVALHMSGRTQESSSVFSQARTVFDEQLGMEPSSELSRLHARILQNDEPVPFLRLPPPTSSQSEDVRAQESLLERDVSPRDTELLARLLRGRERILLTGTAGMGKTHMLRTLHTRFAAEGHSVSLLTATPLSRAVPLGIFTGTLPDKWMTPASLVDHYTRSRSSAVLLIDNVQDLDDASLFVVGQLARSSRLPMILTARELTDTSAEIHGLYDSGELTEVSIKPLSPADLDHLVMHTIGGVLTPDARAHILTASRGVPLHARELLTASQDAKRLVQTTHGWRLADVPVPTARLSQLVGERFSHLSEEDIEAAALVAIAGEYPTTLIAERSRRALVRTGIVAYSTPKWIRLAHPLDREFLREHCTEARWSELSREVMDRLLGDAAADHPAARRRAHILALDLGETLDAATALTIAEHALGAFDERLALRAALSVITKTPDASHAHRIAGIGASALGSEDAAAHFDTARWHAATAAERVAVALAHAQHLGGRRHDATAALAIITEAMQHIEDPVERAHLECDAARWSVTAGQAAKMTPPPSATADTKAVLGLITVGMSGVITGPHSDAERAIARLRHVPEEIIAAVPGGSTLVELTEIMALSNTGDVLSTRDRLQEKITYAATHGPEPLGAWEYALGFTELLAGDAKRARELGEAASIHLNWRDDTGLLPAARALAGAATHACGDDPTAREVFGTVPSSANNDPKVVMLRAWADAWSQNKKGDRRAAARRLVDSSRWLLLAQHSFLAGMLVHCAVRAGERVAEAVELIEEAHRVAGGGLLHILVRHGVATLANDYLELAQIAHEARTLGMDSMATDTEASISRFEAKTDHRSPMRVQASSHPAPSSMALWS